MRPTGRRRTLPCHPSKELNAKTWQSILKDLRLKGEQMLTYNPRFKRDAESGGNTGGSDGEAVYAPALDAGAEAEERAGEGLRGQGGFREAGAGGGDEERVEIGAAEGAA